MGQVPIPIGDSYTTEVADPVPFPSDYAKETTAEDAKVAATAAAANAANAAANATAAETEAEAAKLAAQAAAVDAAAIDARVPAVPATEATAANAETAATGAATAAVDAETAATTAGEHAYLGRPGKSYYWIPSTIDVPPLQLVTASYVVALGLPCVMLGNTAGNQYAQLNTNIPRSLPGKPVQRFKCKLSSTNDGKWYLVYGNNKGTFLETLPTPYELNSRGWAFVYQGAGGQISFQSHDSAGIQKTNIGLRPTGAWEDFEVVLYNNRIECWRAGVLVATHLVRYWPESATNVTNLQWWIATPPSGGGTTWNIIHLAQAEVTFE